MSYFVLFCWVSGICRLGTTLDPQVSKNPYYLHKNKSFRRFILLVAHKKNRITSQIISVSCYL